MDTFFHALLCNLTALGACDAWNAGSLMQELLALCVLYDGPSKIFELDVLLVT